MYILHHEGPWLYIATICSVLLQLPISTHHINTRIHPYRTLECVLITFVAPAATKKHPLRRQMYKFFRLWRIIYSYYIVTIYKSRIDSIKGVGNCNSEVRYI